MKFPLPADVELEFFRQLWKKSADPFWLCECVDDDFVMTAFNPAQRVLLPLVAEGASVRALLGGGAQAEILLSGYFECRNAVKTVVFRQQPVVDGEERLFQTLLVPVTNAQGAVTHICGTARDLTHFLRTQRALEDINRQLEKRVEERTQALNEANAELREANQVLEQLASSDGLTELANRRRFFDLARAEIQRAQRYKHSLSLQMLDIDHFKAINDRFGHLAGDHVLRGVANILRANLRHNDVAARIGGEEFAILLPETEIGDAVHHAERLRRIIESSVFPFGAENLEISVSIGVSGLSEGEWTLEPVLMGADNSLYQAKQDGRNLVRFARVDPVGGEVGFFGERDSGAGQTPPG